MYFLLSLPLCVLVIISLSIHKKAMAHKHETEEGLKILKQEKSQIYISGSYLNVDAKRWQNDPFIPFIVENKHPCYIGKQKLVYHDNWPSTLIIADIQDTEKIISIEVGGGGVVTSWDSSNIALSNDESMLAYVIYPDTQRKDDPDMVICDLSDFKKKVFHRVGDVGSISWSKDDKEIFFGIHKGIFRVSLVNDELEFITRGSFPKALPEGSLGFWYYRESKDFCCKMDMNTRKIIELFSLEDYLRGADWSPDGRYVIAYVFSDYWFIRECIGLPLLIDTETGRKYRLPETTSSKYAERPFKVAEGVEWL